ncbi:MAG: SdpI family protein [Candidatus Eremiobacteraeota bacterium]|nr:SdpI family protein [Candidatus Eremiobacteraeota bacterium]
MNTGSTYLLISIYVLAALLLVMSVPLANGKVAPNGVFGFRTARTLRDANTWYAANRFSGRVGIACAVAMAALGTLLMIVGRTLSFSQFALWATACELMPLAAATIVLLAYNSRL